MCDLPTSFIQLEITAKVIVVRMCIICLLKHPVADCIFIQCLVPHLDFVDGTKPWIGITKAQAKTECIEVHFFGLTQAGLNKLAIEIDPHLSCKCVFSKSPM